jgi:hypothetical protein
MAAGPAPLRQYHVRVPQPISDTAPTTIRDRVRLAAPWVGVVVGMTVATSSVVQYRLSIVLTYSVLVVLLGVWILPARVARPLPSAAALGATIAGCVLGAGIVHVRIRPYTYLTSGQGWTVRWILCATAVLAAGLLLAAAHRRLPLWAPVAAAAVGYLIAAILLIHWDPAPTIDVWVTLQQAADGIRHGQNIYAMNWTGSPGVQDSFTYLPFTALLLAPGRWLAGDVRWMLIAVTLAGATLTYLLGRSHDTRTQGRVSVAQPDSAAQPGSVAQPGSAAQQDSATQPRSAAQPDSAAQVAAAGAAVLLLLMPGTPTQVEQAWTEPLLMACLAGWVFGLRRRLPLVSIVFLALGLASKQHLVLLLPMLAAWPGFGWRRTLASMGLAGVFVLPWFLASPADFVHDTVTVLINFQPLRFADTLFIASMQELNWTPPFWLTGALVLAVVGSSAVFAARRKPDLPMVLRWAALVLFVANLVNKQAFYNQYWLVAALVLLSLATPPERGKESKGDQERLADDSHGDDAVLAGP